MPITSHPSISTAPARGRLSVHILSNDAAQRTAQPRVMAESLKVGCNFAPLYVYAIRHECQAHSSGEVSRSHLGSARLRLPLAETSDSCDLDDRQRGTIDFLRWYQLAWVSSSAASQLCRSAQKATRHPFAWHYKIQTCTEIKGITHFCSTLFGVFKNCGTRRFHTRAWQLS